MGRLMALGALVGLAACAPLNKTTLPRQVGQPFVDDPARASALCGYAVQGLEPAGPGLAEVPGSTLLGLPLVDKDAAMAIVAGRPRASPGVPAGRLCRGRVGFTFDRAASAEGTALAVTTPPRVLERLEPVPAGAPPQALAPPPTAEGELTSGRLLIPLAVSAYDQRVTGRDWGNWDVSYWIQLDGAFDLSLALSCPNRPEAPRVIDVYEGDARVARLDFSRPLRAEPNGVEARVAPDNNHLVLHRPGAYRLHVDTGGACDEYLLLLSPSH